MVEPILFEFGRPHLLTSVVIVLATLLVFGLYAIHKKHKYITDFSKYFSLAKLGNIQFKRNFLVLFFDLCIIALIGMLAMQPTIIRSKVVPDYEKRYFSVWIDASLSALAEDIVRKTSAGAQNISRLDYEKEEVLSLLKRINGDFVGLGIFADNPYDLVLPALVDDSTRANERISFGEELDKVNRFTIPQMKQGSDLGAVILAAIKLYRQPEAFSGNQPKRIVIILTDGEPVGKKKKLIDNMERALRIRSEHDDLSFYIVGVGNPYNAESPEGSIIPIPNETGLMEPFRDEHGEVVHTKPDFGYLSKIAKDDLGGTFIEAKGGNELMIALDNINAMEKRIIGKKTIKIKEKGSYRYIALLCLLIIILRICARNPFRK